MRRNVENLKKKEYDIVVIGGGIHGACVAWDAALRGWRVALIERGDFGAETSANSLKIIHGGLRYLQQLDFKRMRQSIRERSTLMRIAPHLVHQLHCVLPTYGHGMKGRLALWFAMKFVDMIGYDRNRGISTDKRLKASTTIAKKKILALMPKVHQKKLTGAAYWNDAFMHNPDRVTLSFIRSANLVGADVVNYVSAQDLIEENGRITGVEAKDEATGDSFSIKTRMVVNAAGPWINQILYPVGASPRQSQFRLTKAFNIFVNRPIIEDVAAGVYHPEGGQTLFAVPWRGGTLIGTAHLPFSGKIGDWITEDEINEFLGQINRAYPGAKVRRRDVAHIYAGLLPGELKSGTTTDVHLKKKFEIIDHRKENKIAGLISIVGVKYTTARDVAEKVLDCASKQLGRSHHACQTATKPIWGGHISSFAEYLRHQINLYRDWGHASLLRHLIFNYGSAWVQVAKEGGEPARGLKQVTPELEVTISEILNAVRHEMCVKLSDVVMRRTALGTKGHPGVQALRVCADLMGDHLGWSEDKKVDEINECQEIFSSPAHKMNLKSYSREEVVL